VERESPELVGHLHLRLARSGIAEGDLCGGFLFPGTRSGCLDRLECDGRAIICAVLAKSHRRFGVEAAKNSTGGGTRRCYRFCYPNIVIWIVEDDFARKRRHL